MARKKSVNDILGQYERISQSIERAQRSAQGARSQQLWSRNARATAAMDKYIDNIRGTKSQQSKMRMHYDREDVMGRLNNIKYSQRTYMGMSNG